MHRSLTSIAVLLTCQVNASSSRELGFQPKRFATLTISGSQIAADDLDGDGFAAVWWNGPQGFNPSRVTRLPSQGPHGMTLSPGNQRDGGAEEYYESRSFLLPAGARPQTLRWVADVPKKTWIKAQLRFADTEAALAKAPWLGPQGPNSWYAESGVEIRSPGEGRWLMYRLALGAKNGLTTPRVREVAVEYGLPPGASGR